MGPFWGGGCDVLEGQSHMMGTKNPHIECIFDQFWCHMWHQNWHQYVCEPHYVNLFFVNLLHSPGVWFFDIPYDIFWHFDTSLRPPQPITGLFFFAIQGIIIIFFYGSGLLYGFVFSWFLEMESGTHTIYCDQRAIKMKTSGSPSLLQN